MMPTHPKAIIRQTYDEVAADYDHPANAFFSQAATKPMLQQMNLAANSHILDIGTGTGVFALYVAQQRPDSQVLGIDLSSAMLAQARQKALANKLRNVQFQQMDMEALYFADQSFDAISCCFSLYFLDDMGKGLQHIASKLKPNGTLAISFYKKTAFLPLSSLFKQHYALFKPSHEQAEPWENLSDAAFIEALFQQAGMQTVRLHHEPVGFYLSSAPTWWDILWNTGYRRLLTALSAKEQAVFKQKHMTEVAKLCQDAPYWVDTSMIIALGHKQH